MDDNTQGIISDATFLFLKVNLSQMMQYKNIDTCQNQELRLNPEQYT